MTSEQMSYYANPVGDFKTSLDKFRYWHQVSSGFVDGQPIPSSKLRALGEIHDSLGGEKLLVWAYYRQDIERIYDYFKGQCVKIHGDTKDREKLRKEFLKNAGKTVLVANQRAFGIGTNLTPVRYVVYYSNSYNYEDRVQSEDRVHRIGQKDSVFIIDLVTSKADTSVLNAYSRGKSIQEYLKS